MKTKRMNIRLIFKHKNNGENNNNEVLGSRSSNRKKRGRRSQEGDFSTVKEGCSGLHLSCSHVHVGYCWQVVWTFKPGGGGRRRGGRRGGGGLQGLEVTEGAAFFKEA